VIFEESATALEQSLPDTIPEWFSARIDALMVNCGDITPAVTTPEAGDVGSTGGGAAGTGTDTTGTGTTGTGTTGTDNTDTGTTGN
jgi:hypothetical protein